MPFDMERTLVSLMLKQGRRVDQLSTWVTAAGVAGGLLLIALETPASAGSLLVAWIIVGGFAQKYWAMRVAFDAEVFAVLASDAEALPRRTFAMDRAMEHLGFRSPQEPARSWADRQSGALRLLRTQVIAFIAQTFPLLTFLLLGPWLSL